MKKTQIPPLNESKALYLLDAKLNVEIPKALYSVLCQNNAYSDV